MMQKPILIVDDDSDLCQMLSMVLTREGMSTSIVHNGDAALDWLANRQAAAVLLDVRLPDKSGLDVIRAIKSLHYEVPVIVISAYAGVLDAVGAFKAGAFDYLPKPFENQRLILAVNQALSSYNASVAVERKNTKQSVQTSPGESLTELMGPSAEVSVLSRELERVVTTDYSVIIQGETGTGKELIARYLHHHSFRAKGPFVAVDCGAISESLMENEFFGHEKGAYTGADRQQIGRFEAANGGTLFLDEIANLSFNAQALLLRALQERVIRRVGGVKDIPIDVRVLAASNVDLEQAVREGHFREDLLYRINDFSLRLPSLRQRRDDILFLAYRFLKECNQELNKSVKGFTPEAEQKLLDFSWPGNVRELRGVIRRAVLNVVQIVDVSDIRLRKDDYCLYETQVSPHLPIELGQRSLRQMVADYKQRLEAAILRQALNQTGGNKAEAARLLHIDYKTIHTKLKKLGI